MSDGRTYSRGYLPHRDAPGASQFLTWRLHDALDAQQWQAWKAAYVGDDRKAELYRLADQALDRHEGSALFRRTDLGRAVMECLLSGHDEAYQLLAAVVMPNHVHAVLRLEPKVEIGTVLKSLKGASAHRVNRLLGRTGRLWQPDYFDRVVRDAQHLDRCIGYVHWNPVKAGLCDDPRHYACSTANPFYEQRLTVREV